MSRNLIYECCRKIFISDRAFYKKVAVIAIPITLQSLITIGINLAGTMMLGALGEYQLSAGSLANNFIGIFQILCMGMGFGTAVMTSQYWGSKDTKAIKTSITIMYRINLVTAVFFTLITLIFPHFIMSVYSNDAHIIQYGVEYLKIIAFTYVLQGLSLTTTIILRSIGKVKVPLYSSMAAFLLNLLFGWLFIYGGFGIPAFGMAGAAMGTLLARIFEFLVILLYFLREKNIGYKLSDFLINCKEKWSPFLHYALPVIISDFLLALGLNIIAVIVGHISPSLVSANAIIAIVLQMVTIFSQGISNAGSIIIGNTIGEGGEAELTYHQGVTFFALSAIIGFITAFIIQLLAPVVINMYRLSPETKEIAYELMNALSLTVIFQTVSTVMTKGVLRGGGDTKFLMIADILFLWVASVPLGILCAYFLQVSPFMIYISLRIDHMLKTIWCLQRLNSRKWIRTI